MAKTTKKPATKLPPAAVKRKVARRAPKKRTIAAAVPATEEVRKSLGDALRANARALAVGPSNWKSNKHGYEKGALSCYSCSWYQPYINEPNRQTQQIVGASQIGWCRAGSVPATNLNMSIWFDGKSGSFRTSGYYNGLVSDTQALTEVIVYDATEYWCAEWTRTLNPFLWPPNYVQPPPVPNGGP